ncbi:MAG: OsmC family protein [Rhodospirillales bacterium]|nr:OsmC family protein [Rhodospirillales bacterium]
MNAEDLRALQAPLKQRYRETPATAVVTLKAEAELDEAMVACSVETARGMITAGLHPASGGDGSLACSGDMLLQALIACAGVTVKAVATALDITLEGGWITAEGDLDFRGTLGVDREASVGFGAIRLSFALKTDASPEKLATLLKLTERYCVVLQTLRQAPPIEATMATTAG